MVDNISMLIKTVALFFLFILLPDYLYSQPPLPNKEADVVPLVFNLFGVIKTYKDEGKTYNKSPIVTKQQFIETKDNTTAQSIAVSKNSLFSGNTAYATPGEGFKPAYSITNNQITGNLVLPNVKMVNGLIAEYSSDCLVYLEGDAHLRVGLYLKYSLTPLTPGVSYNKTWFIKLNKDNEDELVITNNRDNKKFMAKNGSNITLLQQEKPNNSVKNPKSVVFMVDIRAHAKTVEHIFDSYAFIAANSSFGIIVD